MTIEVLINMKKEEDSHETLYSEASRASIKEIPKDYETQLVKYEEEIRSHIKCEQQLKLHLECI